VSIYYSQLIIPLFALANIGVHIDFSTLKETVTSSITSGLIFGRVIGKIVGITLFAWLAIQLKIAIKLKQMPSFVLI
jgi:NhaA family Na+:H+ antiporter